MGGSSKKQTVGYRYYMDLHMGICYGPVDRIRKILWGDRQAWRGDQDAAGTITISAPELFGGDEKEGGVKGSMHVMMGEQTQTLPSAVAAKLPSPSPAFRGILSLFYSGQVSANNPYIKPVAPQVERILEGWHGDTAWYPEKAPILVDSDETSNPPITAYALGVVRTAAGTSDPQLQPIPPGFEGVFPPQAPGSAWDTRIVDPTDTEALEAAILELGKKSLGDYNSTGSSNFDNCTWIEPDPEDPLPVTYSQFQCTYTPTGSVLQNGNDPELYRVVDAPNPDAMPIYGMNPAHIIYQCLTDPVWGMGYPTTTIGTTFAAAADTLFDEGFGLCMIWNKAEEIGAFVRQVLDHIGGVMYVDPKTGLFELKLLRGDYDAETLPVFDETNIVALESFQRVGYGDTVNEISVVYRDVVTNKDTPVTVQNLANIQAQGGVVSQTKQYPGLPTSSLALRVAQRDLLAASTPLAKGRMKVNRQAWNIAPGGVFVLTWPKLGIESIVMRVLGIGYGTLRDGTITVEVAEDVFGLPAASYAEQEDSGWTEPSTKPVPVVQQTVAEVPYRSLVSELTATELAAVDQDAAYFSILAARPSGLAQAFDIWSRVGSASFQQQGTGAFVPGAALNGAITKTTTEIDLESAADLQLVTAGSLAIIGTGREAEWVLVEAIDADALTMTVSRGMLDTVPKAHADGARVWFDDARDAPEQIERATGETVDFKLATISTGGTLDIGLASEFSATAAQRQFRPYPPGKLTIGGQTYPAALTDTQPVLAWAHRDRLQQTADFIEQSEGNIGPEAGVTYSVLLTNADTAAVIASVTGLTGTSYTPANLFGALNLRVQVWAVRDGVESWQRHDHTLAYSFLRRLDAENGNNLLTEAGDYINLG